MIIADTGFWVALLDRRDTFRAIRLFATRLDEPLVTTVPVLTEVCYLLLTRCGPGKASEFLSTQREDLFQLFAVGETALPRMATLMRQYENLPMDFADASLVILAEHLGHG